VTGDGDFAHEELARLDHLFGEALRLAASPHGETDAAQILIRVPLAEACSLWRARGLQPERMIIMLKRTWRRMRDTSATANPGAQDAQDALDRVVRDCIEQYFAAQPTPATSAPNPRS
jgi:hypothetical protein